MRTSFTPTLNSSLALALLVVASVWWLTVPGLMATSTFIALCVILAASVWVVMSTFENGRPASSLAQSLHDESSAAVKRAGRRSSEY